MSDKGIAGYRTTFHAMFGPRVEGGPRVDQVEIPLIQRDYAQGREDPRASAIRSTFLDALYTALTEDAPVGLDFIYGEVRDRTFEPLDGQQRLTTLFLLHWYLASRCDARDAQPWRSFTYATRPSARRFCERIVTNPPPADLAGPPSAWITDQSWYLHLWRFDPTIRAMLVTLDAIAERFADEDAGSLWGRLTDEARPAIWFQLLPIDEMGAAADLYIKMNSRGRPLTSFEALKAHLGPLVAEAGSDDFGAMIDGPWTDLLWPYRGENDIVDDDFMRYFHFLMEVCEWREGRVRGEEALTPEQRISALLASSNPSRHEHLEFICAAFNKLVEGPPVSEVFARLFTTSVDVDGERVRLFGATSTDLFRACCEKYGATRGATRLFSLTDTLLLYAALVHRIHGTEDASARLRILRNVNEASQFEMRVQNMPKLIAEVAAFMQSGDLKNLDTFNQNQVVDEALKREFVGRRPDLAPSLARFEDHSILRGTLAAFDMNASTAARATAFEAVFEPKHWPALTGALLATGEYQRDYPDSDQHRFGSPTTESVWRLLLVDRGDREALSRIRSVLGRLLDRMAASTGDTQATLKAVADEFLDERIARSRYDWRYYLVRYPVMRDGNSGIYYGADGRLGYELTMLRKTVQRSYYRDAYLYAIWCEAGQPIDVEDPWFYGYSTTPRWMKLAKSGAGLRSVPAGVAVQTPATPATVVALQAECSAAGAVPYGEGWLLRVPQADQDGDLIDTADRVQVAAGFLRQIIDAGL
jgi:hypothetical protein